MSNIEVGTKIGTSTDASVRFRREGHFAVDVSDTGKEDLAGFRYRGLLAMRCDWVLFFLGMDLES